MEVEFGRSISQRCLEYHTLLCKEMCDDLDLCVSFRPWFIYYLKYGKLYTGPVFKPRASRSRTLLLLHPTQLFSITCCPTYEVCCLKTESSWFLRAVSSSNKYVYVMLDAKAVVCSNQLTGEAIFWDCFI